MQLPGMASSTPYKKDPTAQRWGIRAFRRVKSKRQQLRMAFAVGDRAYNTRR
jgi:hypothetical protein